MILPPRRLSEMAQGDADANGDLTLRIGYVLPYRRWKIIRTSVLSTSVTRHPMLMYRNSVTPGSFIQGTSDGRRNQSGIGVELGAGESALFVISGADAGAHVTINIDGYEEPAS